MRGKPTAQHDPETTFPIVQAPLVVSRDSTTRGEFTVRRSTSLVAGRPSTSLAVAAAGQELPLAYSAASAAWPELCPSSQEVK
jgi:hypothetical protein